MVFYAFGSNGSGQLGIGHRDDKSSPQICLLSSTAKSKPNFTPLRAIAGGNTTVVLSTCGHLYAAGAEILPMDSVSGDTGSNVSTFRQCILTHKARLCTLTWEAAVIVSTENVIHIYGGGSKGELGLGPDTSCIPIARRGCELENFPPTGTNIIDLASSVNHVVVVLSTGEVYGWGNGRSGQLADPAEIVWSPRKLKGLDFKVVRAVCGKNFTYLLGDPTTGEHIVLGTEKWGIKSQAPPHVKNWKEVGASWSSLFVLDSFGNLQSWGRNDHGQLAQHGLPTIAAIATGSEHVLALTEHGLVYCWGWGEHGNCGKEVDENGDVKGKWNAIQIRDGNQSLRISGIGAGCATTFLCTGEAFTHST